MSNLRILEESFTPQDCQKPQLDLSETLAAMQTNIRVRIHRSVMDRILDCCAFDRFSPDGDEYYIVSFPFIENDYYYDALLGLGSACECLKPLRVRAETKKDQRDGRLIREIEVWPNATCPAAF